MSIVTKKKTDTLSKDKTDDILSRLNSIELDIAEAKKFSHLSSDVFIILQNQINEIKYILAVLIQSKGNSPKDGQGIYL